MATGDTLSRFRPGEANFPPTSQTGSILVSEERVLSFPDDGDNPCRFGGKISRSYAGTTGARVRVTLSMASATAGDLDLFVAWERRVGKSLRTRTFATPGSRLNMAVPSNQGEEFNISFNFDDGTAMDSVAAGDFFALRVRRRGTTDAAAGDMLIHEVEIEER